MQQVCGTLLYYAIAIDNTIIPAISNISSEQPKSTTNTAKQVAKLLNYLASNPQAEIQYRARGVQFAIHSDASYLSVAQSRSRASGVHFLTEGPPDPRNPEYFVPTTNGILLVVCKNHAQYHGLSSQSLIRHHLCQCPNSITHLHHPL